MAETNLDWNDLARAYARLLEERGPSWRGTPYEGATHTSRDPGNQRWREGEVSSDVGWLDPVDMLAGMLSAPTRTAVKSLSRQMVRPGLPAAPATPLARRPAIDLGDEAMNARLKALLEGRSKTGRGTERLLEDVTPAQTSAPRSYTEMEEMRDLMEAVKRYSAGQGQDIPPRRVPSGQWPQDDPSQHDLAEMLKRLMEGESTPARARDLQQLLKHRYHGGGRVEPDDIVEDAWGWGPQGTPPPWDPDN